MLGGCGPSIEPWRAAAHYTINLQIIDPKEPTKKSIPVGYPLESYLEAIEHLQGVLVKHCAVKCDMQ